MFNILFITNLPSFYKINLYNLISDKKNIYVIFTGDDAAIRNEDFFKGERKFEHTFLKGRSGAAKTLHLLRLLKNVKYRKLIVQGWDSLPMWIAVLKSPTSQNALILESSYHESVSTGIKGCLKKCFLKRISTIFVPGEANKKLAENLGFRGKLVKTKGVGVFNIRPQHEYVEKDQVTNFLYVGRLSPEKNLKFLIETFNHLPALTLNIVGYGPEEHALKAIASSNVKFHGFIENAALFKFYQANDVFVLPSLSEPWGLVVEEALNNGLPVIVSDRVGCAEEIVKEGQTGLIFQVADEESFYKVVERITNVAYYNSLRKHISTLDFNKIAQVQVLCYLA